MTVITFNYLAKLIRNKCNVNYYKCKIKWQQDYAEVLNNYQKSKRWHPRHYYTHQQAKIGLSSIGNVLSLVNHVSSYHQSSLHLLYLVFFLFFQLRAQASLAPLNSNNPSVMKPTVLNKDTQRRRLLPTSIPSKTQRHIEKERKKD